MPLTAGDKLGPYEVLELIGKGGMGEVYRAHDPRTGRDVALKVSADRFSERFDREVGPYCPPRLIGVERFYDRLELDAWIDRLGSATQQRPADWLDRVERDLDQSSRR